MITNDIYNHVDDDSNTNPINADTSSGRLNNPEDGSDQDRKKLGSNLIFVIFYTRTF